MAKIKLRPRRYISHGDTDNPTPEIRPATGPEPPDGVFANYRPPSSFPGFRLGKADRRIIKQQYNDLKGLMALNRKELAEAQDTIINYHRHRFNYRYTNKLTGELNYSLNGFIKSAEARYKRFRDYDDELTTKFYETQGLMEQANKRNSQITGKPGRNKVQQRAAQRAAKRTHKRNKRP